MHILDIILYFVIGIILWSSLREDYTEEIGGIIGLFIMIVYTIIYIILFGVVDYNWIDIFRSIGEINWSAQL